MAKKSIYKNTWHATKEVFAKKRLSGFYDGFQMVLLRNIVGTMLYFVFRDGFNDFANKYFNLSYWDKGGLLKSSVINFSIGYFAGCAISFCTHPFKTFQYIAQSHLNESDISYVKLLNDLNQRQKINFKNIYRGYFLTVSRAAVSIGIFNICVQYFSKISN